MKLKPETLAFLRNLSKQERQAFLAYLNDADENVKSAVNHIDDNDDRYVTSDEKESQDPVGVDEYLHLNPNERLRRHYENEPE